MTRTGTTIQAQRPGPEGVKVSISANDLYNDDTVFTLKIEAGRGSAVTFFLPGGPAEVLVPLMDALDGIYEDMATAGHATAEFTLGASS